MYRKLFSAFLFLLTITTVSGQLLKSKETTATLPAKLQSLVDSLQIAGNFPGLSAAVILKDGKSVAVVAGFNDKEKQTRLRITDRFMQGSVGKTYVSAIALKLLGEGKMNLDEKVSKYLGQYDWWRRIPNAEDITIRMIMTHTSGVMRYEFKPAFTKDLTANPGKNWKPEELLAYVLDEKASFKAGEGWEYSDTNYILLGMIIEKLTGEKYYKLLEKQILVPLKLENTIPSDERKLKGLAQGYAGNENEFGGKDKVIDDDGHFIINPQFEWTGGGIYSTTSDLAKWGSLLYQGKAIDSNLVKLMIDAAVPAKLGRETKYGLGVIIRNTALGPAFGHSGFFPGYMTEMFYFPDYKMTVAVQTNSSDFKNLKLSLLRCLVEIGKLAKEN